MPTAFTYRSVSIVEHPEFWMIRLERGFKTHNTAIEALEWIRSQDAVEASKGHNVMTTIVWEPTTPLGRQIVRVIAEIKL